MSWRSKTEDLNALQKYSSALAEFMKKKEEKWENIEDEVQMSIVPGSPGEDWINPPDLEKTSKLLQQDADYRRLRNDILRLNEQAKEINQFLKTNTHHSLDWINFNDPLIGNDALEDGIEAVKKLIKACQNSNYFFKNLFRT